MTTLLLVRHGQSVWNAEGRWQGRADIDLSPEGEAQCEEAEPRVATLPFTACVHSGLRRTIRTAALLTASLEIVPEAEPGLAEYDVGEWSGMTRPEIEARWPGALDQWFDGTLPATPGGESRVAFTTRIVDALHRVALTHPGGTVLCVTHGGVIGALQRHFQPDVTGPRMGNLSGRWMEIDWESEREAAAGEVATRPTPVLGEVLHLLVPDHETASPTS